MGWSLTGSITYAVCLKLPFGVNGVYTHATCTHTREGKKAKQASQCSNNECMDRQISGFPVSAVDVWSVGRSVGPLEDREIEKERTKGRNALRQIGQLRGEPSLS